MPPAADRSSRRSRPMWRRSIRSRSPRARRRSRSSATGDQWRLQNRDSYPATPEKIRALIANLDGSRARGAQDAQPAAVRAPRARGSQGSECQLPPRPAARRQGRRARRNDRRQETLAGGGLGKAGTYVRKPGDEQTWLATADISGGTGLRDWTKARIFETASDKITKLTIELPGEAAYDIVRDADRPAQARRDPCRQEDQIRERRSTTSSRRPHSWNSRMSARRPTAAATSAP